MWWSLQLYNKNITTTIILRIGGIFWNSYSTERLRMNAFETLEKCKNFQQDPEQGL